MPDKVTPCIWYDPARARAAFAAMMEMQKIDIAALEAAADAAG